MTDADIDRKLLIGRMRRRAGELQRDAIRAARLGDEDLAKSLRVIADELDCVVGRAAAVSGVKA